MELSPNSNLKFKFQTPKAGNLMWLLFLVLSRRKTWGVGDEFGAMVTNNSALAKIISLVVWFGN
jgi:hypothetical protein